VQSALWEDFPGGCFGNKANGLFSGSRSCRFTSHFMPPMRGREEKTMAKGQQKSNREQKKPKAAKPPKAPVSALRASDPASRSTLERIGAAKKKG
jgi:hypothetical protein